MITLLLTVCLIFNACAFVAVAEEELDPENCPHNNVMSDEWLTNCSYVKVDEKKHKVIGYVVEVTYCEDCGEVLTYEETNITRSYDEEHWFEDGKCTRCYCLNTCPHAYVVPNYDYYKWTEGPTRTDNGDGTHTVRGYGSVESSEYCSVCDESWVTNVSEEGPIVYTEAHYFWEGVCEGCGAENTCFHAHVHSHDDFVADIVYEPIDEKTHKVTGTTQDWNFCPECRESWYGENYTEGVVETDAHYFVDGICKSCGYENTCTHENVGELEDIWMAVGTEYVGYDDQCHTIYAYVNHFLVCEDCGEELEYLYCDLQPEVKEAHSFENGSCNCGYVEMTGGTTIAPTAVPTMVPTAVPTTAPTTVSPTVSPTAPIIGGATQAPINTPNNLGSAAPTLPSLLPTPIPDDPYGDSVAYLPDSLKVIDAEALLGIAARTVVIPDGATAIGARAFASCPNLEYVVVPDSVRSIADDAFSGSSVTFICSTDSTAADYAQSHNIPLK